MLRLPFEPLAAGRVPPALPVMVRLVADHQHRVAVIEHGACAVVLVRGSASIVDAIRTGPAAGRGRCSATTERRMGLGLVRRERAASRSGWPARAIPHGRPPLSPGGPKRKRRTRASGLTAVVGCALPAAEDRPALMRRPTCAASITSRRCSESSAAQCRNDDRKQPCGTVWTFSLLSSPRRVVTELTVDDREHRRIVAAAEPGKTPMDGYGRQSPW